MYELYLKNLRESIKLITKLPEEKRLAVWGFLIGYCVANERWRMVVEASEEYEKAHPEKELGNEALKNALCDTDRT